MSAISLIQELLSRGLCDGGVERADAGCKSMYVGRRMKQGQAGSRWMQ